MNLTELCEALQQKGVELWVEGDLLRFRMPGNLLDKELLAELRRHKKALIDQLRQAPPRDGSEQRLENLSLGQQALYFLHALSPRSAAYNVAASFRIGSGVNVEVMRHCFQTLISRHEALRTTFVTVDGLPRCRIHSHQILDFQQLDASDWTSAQLHAAVVDEYLRPFRLHEGPLLRVRLFTTAADNHVFLMTLHHIVFDAWSLWLLQEEFDTLYRHQMRGDTAVLPSLAAGYSDFVRWQTELQDSERGERLWEYWRNRFQGELAAPNLPCDFQRPERSRQCGASVKFRIPRELSQQLRELGKSLGATPFVVLLTVFKTLLFRYTGDQDLTVGTTTSGRTESAFARVVGYFVNTLPIRSEIASDATFADYVAHVKQRTLEALEHQDYPFPLLVDRLNPPRDTGRLPLCSVMFGLQKPQQFRDAARLFEETPLPTDWGGLAVHPYDIPQQEGQFDLTCEFFDAHDSFLGSWKYDTDLFRAETAQRMTEHFLQLAASIVEDPHRPLPDYRLMPLHEESLLRSSAAAPGVKVLEVARVHLLFEQQARRSPDRMAVSDESCSMTYGSLNRRANQLARWLRRQGIEPGQAVASQVSRGVDTAVTLLGVLKAGATYVPVDPTCPHRRRAHMLSDSGASLLLSDSRMGPDLEKAGPLPTTVVYLDQLEPSLVAEETEDPRLDFPSRTAAYIIYTSGSTGEPKGVVVSHRALTEHVLVMGPTFGLVAEDCMLQFSNTTFDPSLEQMLVPWSVGARVFVRGNELWSPDEFWEIVRRQAITAINLPPAYFRHCTESLDAAAGPPPTLRLVIVGGDLFPVDTLAKWRAANVRLLNAYGPTEAVITATVHEFSGEMRDHVRIPIGRPKQGLRAYVLDAHRRLVPRGIPGELYLGGTMLADGYLNNPAITTERFLPDPFEGGDSRMYRTGDMACWTHDGELEFLGRHDRQVKVHGYRVEIGEIEARLDTYPAVRASHVQCQRDEHGDACLVAWLVVVPGSTLDRDALRGYLRERLPGYMVPRQFVLLDEFPVNSAGKIDVRALPRPPAERPQAQRYVAPQNAVEQTLVNIWSRALGVDHIGTHDDFFDLGGSSLSSLRIVAMLKESGLPLDEECIKPELLFEYPTVAELAAFWESCNPSLTVTG